MLTSKFKKAIVIALGAAGLLSALPASADILFATSYEDKQIWRVDTSTATASLVTATQGGPDSLIFEPSGNVVYTSFDNGELRRYNPITTSDTLISGSLKNPRDLVLEPGNATVLVSDNGNSRLARVDLTSGATTTLVSSVATDGVVYDPSGNLFVVVGGFQIKQYNPVTGAELNSISIAGVSQLDGMTYDPFTGDLWVSSEGTAKIYRVPTSLASSTSFAMAANPDGVVSNGAGHLFVATRGDFKVYDYDIAANTFTANAFIHGLDDLAPVVGPGSPGPLPGVPLPASVWSGLLLGGAVVGMQIRRRRTKLA